MSTMYVADVRLLTDFHFTAVITNDKNAIRISIVCFASHQHRGNVPKGKAFLTRFGLTVIYPSPRPPQPSPRASYSLVDKLKDRHCQDILPLMPTSKHVRGKNTHIHTHFRTIFDCTTYLRLNLQYLKKNNDDFLLSCFLCTQSEINTIR